MPTFRDAEHVYQCIGGLFDWAKRHPELGPKFRRTEMTIRMAYSAPEAVITVDCAHDPKEEGAYIEWHRGDAGLTAEIEFSMTADVAHQFWLGRVNLLLAMAKRQVVARGPIFKAMKILPILGPMYKQYPELLKGIGQPEMAKT